jgi:maleylacetoacetate isomerase
VYERGFSIYESFIETRRKEFGVGRYSVGNEVSLADVFLVPAVERSLRVGAELGEWPLVQRIVDHCGRLDAFQRGGLGGHGRLAP